MEDLNEKPVSQRQLEEQEANDILTKTDEDLGMRMSDDFLSGLNIGHVQKTIEDNKVKSKEKIITIRKELTDLTKRLSSLPEQADYAEAMGITRNLNPHLFKIADGFFVPPSEDVSREMFNGFLEDTDYGLVSSLGNPRYIGRYIYPVKGFYNEVIGFTGYDLGEIEKYLRSNTVGFDKSYSYYGMHMMNYIYKKKYVIAQEGVVDCLWGWSIDQPFLGALGDSLSEFFVRILKRFDYFTILIPDNDDAGRKAYEYKWKKSLPNASAILLDGVKDIDEWRVEMIKRGYTEEQVKLIFTSIINDILSSAVLGVPKYVNLRVWD